MILFASVSTRDLEDILHVIATRLLIGLHTFHPDSEGVHGWLRRLGAWRDAYPALFPQYVERAAVDRRFGSRTLGLKPSQLDKGTIHIL